MARWWTVIFRHADRHTFTNMPDSAAILSVGRNSPTWLAQTSIAFLQRCEVAVGFSISAVRFSTDHVPVTLHRATAAERTANRAAACATAPRPRPTGYECDEYPYASAAEGAAAGTGTVRVLDLPDWDGTQFCGMPPSSNQTGEGGWSICLIPTGDNRRGGVMLNDLYKAFRVIPGDAFSTRIAYDT